MPTIKEVFEHFFPPKKKIDFLNDDEIERMVVFYCYEKNIHGLIQYQENGYLNVGELKDGQITVGSPRRAFGSTEPVVPDHSIMEEFKNWRQAKIFSETTGQPSTGKPPLMSQEELDSLKDK